MSDRATESSSGVTVIVCTFNSNPFKTIATLKSVLTQDFEQVQLIVVDDGSAESNRSTICKYLDTMGCTDYLYLENEKNLGTVASLLGALQFARAPYVKPISPGDCLYDSQSLSKLVEPLRSGDFAFSFGKAIYYSQNEGEVLVHNKQNPVVRTPYHADGTVDLSLAKRNLIRHWDGLWGVTVAYDKKALSSYLAVMAGRIRLCEDYSTRFMIADGCKAAYVNDWVVWYEYGSGVSTCEDLLVEGSLKPDVMACKRLLSECFPSDEDVSVMLDVFRTTTSYPSGIAGKIIRGLRHPERVAFALHRFFAKRTYRPKHFDLALLEGYLRDDLPLSSAGIQE